MAANQSRRRVEPGDPSEFLSKARAPFQYESLDTTVDCMRLLTIHPSTSEDEPLVCSLFTVKFSDKPQYEALSYMWGSEEDKLPVIVNKTELSVTGNLYDALRYLRAQRRKLPIWIDAISIDQSNVVERTRQLRIMHHIYFRARTVVVWLGQVYEKYDDLITSIKARLEKPAAPDSTGQLTEKPSLDDRDVKSIEELKLVKDLYSDEYWQRLWIIQEIGQAHQLLVCFGRSRPMTWDNFIHFVKMHDLGSDGPSRLHQMRAERETKGGYSLQKLLYDHQTSKCKEAADKVYGLIGLAADAHKFPMDYSKPLIQVWNDVMHFAYTKKLLKESEVIPFGRLVKFLLMSNTTSPLHQVITPYDTSEEVAAITQQSPVAINLPGRILGQIVHIGASTEDIVGKLDSVDAWNAKVQAIFRDHVEKANLESRMLIRAILGPTELRKCFNHTSAIQWRRRFTRNAAEAWHLAWEDSLETYLNTHATSESEDIPTGTDSHDIHPHLFQLCNKWQGERTPWRMGIVAPGAKSGDLLVWISNVRPAIVARPTIVAAGVVSLQIVGTAWVTADVCRTQEDLQRRLEWFTDDWIRVEMDIATIFVLLS